MGLPWTELHSFSACIDANEILGFVQLLLYPPMLRHEVACLSKTLSLSQLENLTRTLHHFVK